MKNNDAKKEKDRTIDTLSFLCRTGNLGSKYHSLSILRNITVVCYSKESNKIKVFTCRCGLSVILQHFKVDDSNLSYKA